MLREPRGEGRRLTLQERMSSLTDSSQAQWISGAQPRLAGPFLGPRHVAFQSVKCLAYTHPTNGASSELVRTRENSCELVRSRAKSCELGLLHVSASAPWRNSGAAGFWAFRDLA